MIINASQNNVRIVNKEGFMYQTFREFTFNVSKLSILTGAGSPEGVVAAEATREYMDTNGTAGNIKYIKRDADVAGDRTKGWILI